MSIIRSAFARTAVRSPLLARTYASPSANEAGKKEAEKAKHGKQEIDADHHTDSEAAVKGEQSNKSVEDMQKDTVSDIKKKHH